MRTRSASDGAGVRVAAPLVPDVHVELRPGEVPAPVVPDLVDGPVVPVRISRVDAAPAAEAVVQLGHVLRTSGGARPERLVASASVVVRVRRKEVMAVRVLRGGRRVVESVGVRPGVLTVVRSGEGGRLQERVIPVDVQNRVGVVRIFVRDVQDVPDVGGRAGIGVADVGLETGMESRAERRLAAGVDARVEVVERHARHAVPRVPRLAGHESPGEPR